MDISIEDYPVRHFSLKDSEGNHVMKNMYDDSVQAFLSDVFEQQAEIDKLKLIKKQNDFQINGQDREISQLVDALEMVLNNAKKFKKQEGLQLYKTVFSDVGFMELKALLAPYKGE